VSQLEELPEDYWDRVERHRKLLDKIKKPKKDSKKGNDNE
jgi:hypothetical protein